MKFRTCVEYSLVSKVYVRVYLHIKYFLLLNQNIRPCPKLWGRDQILRCWRCQAFFKLWSIWSCHGSVFNHYHLLTCRRLKECKNKVMSSYRLVNIGPGTRSGLISLFLAWHRAQIRLFLTSSTWHVLKFDQTCIVNDLFKFAIILLNCETQCTSH